MYANKRKKVVEKQAVPEIAAAAEGNCCEDSRCAKSAYSEKVG
jgi:hypothetical protein